MVLRDIEREDIEFISKTLNCLPISHVDNMRPEKLGYADLVEEVQVSVAAVHAASPVPGSTCVHHSSRFGCNFYSAAHWSADMLPPWWGCKQWRCHDRLQMSTYVAARVCACAYLNSPALLHHQVGSGKVVKVTGIQNQGRTATILLRGSNKLVLEEAERSLHDALCVIRCLVHKRALIPGGAAPEMEVEHQLIQWAKTLQVPCLNRVGASSAVPNLNSLPAQHHFAMPSAQVSISVKDGPFLL